MPEINDQIAGSEPIPSNQFTNLKNPSFRSVYSNQTNFGSSAFDFNMTFGEIVDVDQEARHVTVDQQVRVVMSPLHFKIFAATCVQTLKLYEANFGPIPVPTGAVTAEMAGQPIAMVQPDNPKP
jgi:Protein of unknown function (DUF3467)